MKRNASLVLFGAVIAGLFVLLQLIVIVRQGEVKVVTTFGKPVRALREPGLYFRGPWPVQGVHPFDNRTRVLQGSFEETLTEDGKNVLVSLYAGWRIREPIRFLERVGTLKQAEGNLDGLLRTYKNAVIGQFPFANLVSVDPARLQLGEAESRILAAVKEQAENRYGIEVQFVGVRRIGLPESITQSVFERMKAERQVLADRYKAEGDGESIRIRAQADSERDKLLARAEADAKRLRAAGDAEAAQYYQVFEKDPDLAMFLRKLEVMEETLKEKSTVILSADTEPYDLLRGKPAKTP
jgi:modulator of FtsH protease HflC